MLGDGGCPELVTVTVSAGSVTVAVVYAKDNWWRLAEVASANTSYSMMLAAMI